MTTNRPKGFRVVVADDERDMRQFFEEMLTHLGHQVVGVAHTGKQLIEACRSTQPDLVITDIKMPDMDGLSVLRKLRSGDTPQKPPVAILTAYATAANMIEAKPTIMTAVPRLYETLHQRMVRMVDRDGGWKAKLFYRTVAIGVVAGSAGNHAQALAYAARARGLHCEVFMPRTATVSKVADDIVSL